MKLRFVISNSNFHRQDFEKSMPANYGKNLKNCQNFFYFENDEIKRSIFYKKKGPSIKYVSIFEGWEG